jgi:UrcA family protein
MKKLTTLIALAGITTVLCANAQAGGVSDVPTETVRYTSADAANAAAVATLYRRLDAAAGRVCGERLAPGTEVLSKPWRHCVQSAMRDALAQINMPAVATYAAAHGIVVVDATIASRN